MLSLAEGHFQGMGGSVLFELFKSILLKLLMILGLHPYVFKGKTFPWTSSLSYVSSLTVISSSFMLSTLKLYKTLT